MNIRKSTKRKKYTKFLAMLTTLTAPVNIAAIIKENQVDIKFHGFLKSEGLITVSDKDNETYNIAFTTNTVKDVLEKFLVYRSRLNDQYLEKKKKLASIEKAKIIEKDIEDMSATVRQKIVDEIIDEVISYAELAIQLGKKDIKGFIKAIIQTK